MTLLDILAWAASAAIVITYFISTRGPVRPFHWANALGAAPLVVLQVSVGAWPAAVLSALFGVAGWFGVIHRPSP